MENKVPSIGLIGNGFIGSSIYNAFLHYTDVKIFDANPSKSLHEYVDIISQDVIFLAVPTPMEKDGTVDCSFIEQSLQKLEDNLPAGEPLKPVIIKSTVPPNQLGSFMLQHAEKLLVIFNPEFLTERSAKYEYIQSNRFIFGTLQGFDKTPEAKLVESLFSARFPAVPQYWTSFAEASLAKYFTNVFFASKLSIINEFAQVANKWGVNPSSVIGLVMMDPRIGRSHFQVPGHDGKRGWSGSCFIKDTNGYAHLAQEAGVDPMMAKAAWKKNVEVRGVLTLTEELNEMIGRAASGTFTVEDVAKLGNK